jgi:hypothetical protein
MPKAPLLRGSHTQKGGRMCRKRSQMAIVVLKTARFQPNRYRNKRQTQILAGVKKTKRRIKLLKTTNLSGNASEWLD